MDDLGLITEKLLADGITAFTHSLDELLASLKEKRRVLLDKSGTSNERNSVCSRCVTCAETQRGSGGATFNA